MFTELFHAPPPLPPVGEHVVAIFSVCVICKIKMLQFHKVLTVEVANLKALLVIYYAIQNSSDRQPLKKDLFINSLLILH